MTPRTVALICRSSSCQHPLPLPPPRPTQGLHCQQTPLTQATPREMRNAFLPKVQRPCHIHPRSALDPNCKPQAHLSSSERTKSRGMGRATAGSFSRAPEGSCRGTSDYRPCNGRTPDMAASAKEAARSQRCSSLVIGSPVLTPLGTPKSSCLCGLYLPILTVLNLKPRSV